MSSSISSFRRSAERAFGISFFFGIRQGFSGDLKNRHSDFIVREVALDGRVARLTSMSIPSDEAELCEEHDSESLRLELKTIIGIDSFTELEKLVTDQTTLTKVSVTAPESKDARKRLHTLIRNCFTNLDSASRIESDNVSQKLIDIFRRNGTPLQGNNKSLKRPREHGNGWQRSDWPMHRSPFLNFVLYKQNIDTVSAVRQLSASLGVKERNIGYAGAKDKRGYTAQFMTLFKIHPNRLIRVVQSIRGLSVGNFSFTASGLNLGDLWGNRFDIVVRQLHIRENKIDTENKSTEETVKDSLQTWATNNFRFINYFGRQRFGSAEADGGGTHDIGQAILKKDWTRALSLIFVPRQGEIQECIQMKKAFAMGDLEGSLAAAPSFMRLEISLLRKLRDSGGINSQNAAREAIMSIPPNLRNLYVYAYQSYIWNVLASNRIEMLGLEPVEGDLVLVRPLGESLDDFINLSSNDEQHDIEYDGLELKDTAEVSIEANERDKHIKLPIVHVLTANDISKGLYSIDDVIMPLPGCDVAYPTHTLGATAVADLLIADEVLQPRTNTDSSMTLSDVNLVASIFRSRDLRSQHSGDYRHVVSRARDLNWSIVQVSPYEDVFESDIETMQKSLETKSKDSIAAKLQPNVESSHGSSHASLHGLYSALKVSFSLPRSSYATIALRELMRGE
jgi:tRNA pseudouridine13 synthase